MIFKNNWIIENLITKNERKKITNLVLSEAKVKDLKSLYRFITQSDNEKLYNFNIRISKRKYIPTLEKKVLSRIQKKIKKKISSFPVKVVRVVASNKDSQSPWHQDEGTWRHHDYLSNKKPFTCWLPVVADIHNTLQVCLDEVALKKHRRDKLKRAFYKFKQKEIQNSEIINPKLGRGYIFSCFQPHRSFFNIKKKTVRISIDFRFTL